MFKVHQGKTCDRGKSALCMGAEEFCQYIKAHEYCCVLFIESVCGLVICEPDSVSEGLTCKVGDDKQAWQCCRVELWHQEQSIIVKRVWLEE